MGVERRAEVIEAPIEDRKGNKRSRNEEGTPQGGVISPLLANLFLHYAFDKWLEIKNQTQSLSIIVVIIHKSH
jgi:retron-type reverse transcriptase